MNIGSTIRQMREERGYSLRELAQSCRVGYTMLWRLENDEASLTVLQLVLLAKCLKMAPTTLLRKML
jgi:transcriptional regulator with XRE-family HTH domain